MTPVVRRGTLANGVACPSPVGWIAVTRLLALDFTRVSDLCAQARGIDHMTRTDSGRGQAHPPTPNTRHAHRVAVGSATAGVRAAEVCSQTNTRQAMVTFGSQPYGYGSHGHAVCETHY